jgi:hypothetical protein
MFDEIILDQKSFDKKTVFDEVVDSVVGHRL